MAVIATNVPSVAAERSMRLINRTLAQHRRQEQIIGRSDGVRRGRLHALAGEIDSRQIRRQSTLLRIASIVEAFTADQLVHRLELHVPAPRNSILERIYTQAEDATISSWPRMTERYKQWFAITFAASKCPAWPRIEAMSNARNAIAHGLGDFTRRMARGNSTQMAKGLSAIEVGVGGTTIVLTEASLQRVAEAGIELILWLDDELQRYDSSSTVR